MTDIVERLRWWNRDSYTHCWEAAAEIERLRAMIEDDVVTYRKLMAETERLRAALTKIQYLEASDADTWIWQAQEEAREALAASQDSMAPLERRRPVTPFVPPDDPE